MFQAKRSHLQILVLLMSVCLSAGCAEHPLPVDSHYNRGVEFYDQGNYTDAIKAYKLAIRNQPDNFFAKYNLAVVYQDQGKLREAMGLYQEILEKNEDTNSRINLAAIHYSLNNSKEAYQELKTAAKHDPSNPDLYSAIGEYLERQKKFPEAERAYSKALQLNDKHAVSWFRQGRLYCKMGQSSSCTQRLRTAIELAPGVPLYLEALAEQYARTNQTFEAINILERVALLRPEKEEVFSRLGDLYKKEKLYQEAVQRYWTALSIQDNNPAVHRKLIEVFELMSQTASQKIEKLEAQNSVAQNP